MRLNSKDRESTRDKANINNPKVNRDCAPLTANRTSADCVQISLGPSIPYIPLGVYHTGRFNAMMVTLSQRLLPLCRVYLCMAPASEWLTHWGRDKLANILLITFLKTFSWMNIFDILIPTEVSNGSNKHWASIGENNRRRIGDKPAS